MSGQHPQRRRPWPARQRLGRRAPAVLLALTVLLSACGSGDTGSGGSAEDGGTLIIGMESEADVLDPPRTGSWVTTRVTRQMYEGLIDEDLSKSSDEVPIPPLRPALAESWEVSDDGLVYRFHIRPDVTFHDGTELDAEAAAFNIRRMWDESFEFYDTKSAAQSAFVWQHLTAVETPDPMTLELTMAQPFSAFPRLLTQGGYNTIISPTALAKWGNDEIADHPTGTGPFRFVDRVRGQRITLERNEEYWGERAKLSRVVFRPLPDASTRAAALRAGEVDMIAAPSPDSLQNLRDAGFVVSEGAPPHLWFLSLNVAEGPTSDVRVRQAINLAIDRDGLVSDLLKDTAVPAQSVLPPANAAAVPDPDAYGYDPEEARRLLAEAGFADGFSTVLTTSTSGSGQIIPVEMAEYIQANLADVGIRVEIRASEWISYLTTYNQGLAPEVGMAQMSWGMSSPYWLNILNSSSLVAPNGPNVAGFSSPELDALMQQAATATDEDAADELWKQAVVLAQEARAIAPVVNDKAPYVLSADVRGFVSPSEEWFDLNAVWID
ncbi:peptide/nickel transport system substrate-binding protein [Blastococcus fimeti]|nr:peptide/nickel transport system substrate-binding protein [Blastococcus fimeti]